MTKCYHYCTNEFLEELLEKGRINADSKIYDNGEPVEYLHGVKQDFREAATYAKVYAFKYKQINNGNGMFFAWSNPFYKGNVEFGEDGEYILLELEVDDNICIKTNYENWCSFGMDVDDVGGDFEVADSYCRDDLGFENGLEDSYSYIFELQNGWEVQILLPYIDSKWVKSVRRCFKKRI